MELLGRHFGARDVLRCAFYVFLTARRRLRVSFHDPVTAAFVIGKASLAIESGAASVSRSMTNSTEPIGTPDPIDEEAAEIDARSPNAEEQIEQLVEHAKELGRDAEVPGE